MKIIKINGREYTGVQPQGMSDIAFKSMLVRNAMDKNIADIKAAFERGKNGN